MAKNLGVLGSWRGIGGLAEAPCPGGLACTVGRRPTYLRRQSAVVEEQGCQSPVSGLREPYSQWPTPTPCPCSTVFICRAVQPRPVSSSPCPAGSIPRWSRRCSSAEGYDVVGITLQLYDHGEAVGRKGACCAGQDIRDARRVAEALGIPALRARLREPLRRRRDGRVRRQLSRRRDAGALRRLQPEDQVPRPAEDGRGPRRRRARHRPLCPERARGGRASSFTGPRMASATRAISCSPPRASSSISCAFPSATWTRQTTRKLAREFGLTTAEKSDSQDICFVPTGRYTEIIERLRPGAAEAGDIVHVDGRVLGRHRGIINYTIGQRRGIGVAAAEPLYVDQPRCRCAARSWSARARGCASATLA